eukprot:XP_001703921.1 Hypothetical protein GL50803_107665 [Giardia lamblia ATCC 50803]
MCQRLLEIHTVYCAMADVYGCPTEGPAKGGIGDETDWLLLEEATVRACLQMPWLKSQPVQESNRDYAAGHWDLPESRIALA